ncbi:hypothetical protein J2Z69_000282 [Paenibacillus shirakamiensis]|uniref:Uncharacterized protein n=1 Tax=Paenibacillus shirakamiensis TaxID=1265935 RepID=A0ABS4JC11_9BACL|nr:hypothetical protein [Paenibacillus shirakamiensis]
MSDFKNYGSDDTTVNHTNAWAEFLSSGLINIQEISKA